MFNFTLIALKLVVAFGFAALLSACDEPVSGGALTFYGECIGDDPDSCIMVTPNGSDLTFHVNKEPIIEPHHFADAEVVSDNQNDEVVVYFTLNEEGTARFAKASAARIDKIIFILDEGHLITAPTVREAITSGRGQIVAGFTEPQAHELVTRIRANARASQD